MAAEILEKEGVHIAVNGPDSAYRPFDRQVYWRNYWCSRGACQNAAVPGNSNHGLGLAADCPVFVQALIAKYGPKYGWRKACSDAPWESWHYKWCGGWSGKDPGPSYTGNTYPTLHMGDKGGAVKRAQKHLHRWNLGLVRPDVNSVFDRKTKQAVVQFQIVHDMKADGVIGPKTWKALRKRDKLKPKQRYRLNRLKLRNRRA